jgi:hypothetical protein
LFKNKFSIFNIFRQIFFTETASLGREVSVTQLVPLNVTQFRRAPSMTNHDATMRHDATNHDAAMRHNETNRDATMCRVPSMTNHDATFVGDDVDELDRAAKRRKVQISLESSILEKLTRHERTEENFIPWLQIVERLLEKYPNVFASM